MSNAAVISSGSWGTALAVILAQNGHDVRLWSFSEEKALMINTHKENKEFLPGITLPENLTVTNDREEAVLDCEYIINTTPSKYVRNVMEGFAPLINDNHIIINASKGLEDNTLMRLSEVIGTVCPKIKLAVLSGPSHAEEVSRGIPTACVAAAADKTTATAVQNLFMNPAFRVYASSDIIGVELGGALKNVIALAAGMSDGMGYGDNTKAAIMTRGIAEISRLGVKMGADFATFNGLAGIGDLIVTCTSMHSRNRRAGIMLGEGASLEETLACVHMVVEGVHSARSASLLAKKYNCETPIIFEVEKVLFNAKNPKQALWDLMTRDKTSEYI